MADPFVGEIRAFAFNYAPSGWLACNGAEVTILNYQALYAVIGATYGTAQASSSFKLPNLRGAVPICATLGGNHAQNGFGVLDSVSDLKTSSYALGEESGSATVVLAALPSHGHEVVTQQVKSPFKNMTNTPSGGDWLARPIASKNGQFYLSKSFVTTPPTNAGSLHPATIGSAGGGQAHENCQPFLALNFCICWDGIYPTPA